MTDTSTKQTARKIGRLRGRETRQALGFMSPALAGLALFTFIPVALSIVMSLYDWPAFGERKFVGVDNYVYLLTDSPDFWPALRNSAVFALGYVPFNVITALGLSILIGPRIRGREIFRLIFFIPVVTPIVANVLVWKILLQPDGYIDGTSEALFGISMPNFLSDNHWAMIMVIVMSVWQGMGYNMLIFSAALEQVPTTTLDAATIDGAKGWQLYRKVVIPLISPAIFFAVVMTIISALQVFAQPQLLTGGGPGNSTIPLVQFIYREAFKFQAMGTAAAAAWILFVIIIFLTAFQFKAQKRWVHYEH